MAKNIVLFIFLSVSSRGVFGQENGRPPIIIIMADQLRADVLGDWTPNIMALRRDGVSFTKAYCASPICVPSRGSFFTGRYPNNTGCLINGWEDDDASSGVVKAGIPNLYTVMEPLWDSWHVGKQHFITAERIDRQDATKTKWITQDNYSDWMKAKGVPKPGGPAFKAIVPETVGGTATHTRAYSIPRVHLYKWGLENFTDHYFGNESVDAIKNRDKTKPLLLNVMFLAPHPPFDIPDPYFSMTSVSGVEMPGNVGQWYAGQSPLQLYNLTGFLGARYTRDEWKDVWSKYKGLVKLLDDEVGRIVKALKEEGLYDESIIVFTADHGEMLGSHCLWQKMCMYEESAHVPLFMKFPRDFQTRTQKVEVPVSLIDVFPTLLDVTAITLRETPDGQSLLPLVLAKDMPRSPVFIQYDGNGSLGNFQRCVVDGDYKLTVDIFKDEMFVELYDLRQDGQETTNLAFNKDFQARVRELIDRLRKHMLETNDRLILPDSLYMNFLTQYKSLLKR